MRGDSPRGFTLLELMAALALTGLVLAAATRLLTQIGDSAGALRRAGVASAEDRNGMRLLRALASNAASGLDSSQRFSGSSAAASFATLCDVPGGWREPCRVRLELTTSGDSSSLVASWQEVPALRLWRGSYAALRYVEGTRGDAMIYQEWRSSVSVPLAIVIAARTDTVVLPIGARQ